MTSAVRSNSAKRSASGNLSNSSDDEQDDQIRDLASNRLSISSTGTSDFNTSSSLECSDNPCSPGGSSTSSGPVYIRPPGFQYHAQEIVRPRIKKKKKVFPTQTVSQKQNGATETGTKRVEQPPIKPRPNKRDPLPMRMRAFPQSFWQQPNQPVGVSPAQCHKVLPPLSMRDDIDMVRPVTPEEKTSENTTTIKEKIIPKSFKPAGERKITMTGNAETLLTKMFDCVEKTNPNKKTENIFSPVLQHKTPVPPSYQANRRARPTKHQFTINKTMLHGCDPYMVDTITEQLFPHLTLEKAGVKSYHASSTGGNTSLQLITLKEGDKTVTLPSLCVEQNYSQMLSELVPHL